MLLHWHRFPPVRYIAFLLMGGGVLVAQPSPICAPMASIPPPGTNLGPQFLVRPAVLDFGSVVVPGPSSMQFCITPSNTTRFTVTSSDPATFPLRSTPPGTTGDYNVQTVGFTPPRPGNFRQMVTVSGVLPAVPNGVTTRTIELLGSGVDPLTITTPSALPPGMFGQPYDLALVAAGGVPPYRWAPISGSLPTGLIVNDTVQRLQGTPQQGGTFSFTLMVRDSSSPALSASRAFTLSISQVPLSSCTLALLNGGVGQSFSQPLCARGGSGVYTWRLLSGTLPPGISLTLISGPSTWALTGTPSQAGAFPITLEVRDSAVPPSIATVTLTIRITTLTLCNPLPPAVAGQNYQQLLCVNGGTPPYLVHLSAGVLPPGLMLNESTGIVSGTPTQSGTYPFTVTISDNSSPPIVGSQSLELTVAPPIAILTTALPDGTVGQLYQQALSSSGGNGEHSWRVISGALPPGLSITGRAIAGTPAQEGAFSLALQVSDSSTPPATLSKSFTIAILRIGGRAVISSVLNGASFLPAISASSWVSILGNSLASDTRLWTPDDLASGTLPAVLGGVSVTINGKAAFVEYVSPSQINVIAPADDSVGPVEVRVVRGNISSDPLMVQLDVASPAFFLLDGKHVAALHPDGVLVGPPGLLPNTVLRPARTGEELQLYANGLGPTTPPVPGDKLTASVVNTASPVTVSIGGVPAEVLFAGLVPPYARLYRDQCSRSRRRRSWRGSDHGKRGRPKYSHHGHLLFRHDRTMSFQRSF